MPGAASIRVPGCRWRRCRAVGGLEPDRGPYFARRSIPAAMRGGTSTRSATTADTASRSSPSSAASFRLTTPWRDDGHADPLNHCAVNVAIYPSRSSLGDDREGPFGGEPHRDALTVGPRHCPGTAVADDRHQRDSVADSAPHRRHGSKSRRSRSPAGFFLNGQGNHWWWPLAPCARVPVAMDDRRLRWQRRRLFRHERRR